MTVSETMVDLACAAFLPNWEGSFSSTKLKARKKMRAALTAALSDQVVVPKEPTPEMLEAAYAADAYWLHDTSEVRTEWMDEMSNVWRAMISAAPPPSSTAGEGKSG